MTTVLVLAATQARPADAAENDVTAGVLFRQVEEQYAQLSTLSYGVKRTVTSKRQQAEDQWSFQYRNTGELRIEYQSPHERVIIVNDASLVEYVPSLKKAMKTDLAAMSGEKRQQTVSAVLSRVSVDGLRLGNYAEMEKKVVRVSPAAWVGKDVYLVEGSNPRYAVYLDRNRRVLVRTEIYDKDGKLVLRTAASRFLEVSKDFWMPQEIVTTYSTPEGFVQSKVLLRNIRANDKISDDVFRVALPNDVEVILN